MILKDLITCVLDIVDSDELNKFISNKNPSIKSITRANKDLTMTFPVMVSSTISANSGQLVGRALERKFVTLAEMLLSAISITSSKDAIDHLKNIHSNLDLNNFFDIDDYLNIGHDECVNTIFDSNQVKMVYESYRNQRLSSKPLNHLISNQYNMSFEESGKKDRPKSKPNPTKSTQNTSKDNLTNNLTGGKSNSNKTLDRSLPLVVNADYKKANELQPSILKINFITVDKDNDIKVDAYVGVKTKLYAVDSSDIINHIVSKRGYSFSLYNLIKATSGEIEFWRDFVFALKKAKIDAISNTNRGSSSKLWKVLERRAISSKLNRLIASRNDATAITTLVVSSYDVEMLRKTEDIDISDSRIARRIMDDYNLISIVIVDESTESAEFIFDTGDDEYELYTFKTLKRDDKVDYKQMIQLLAGGR